jgi:hypothetical protein
MDMGLLPPEVTHVAIQDEVPQVVAAKDPLRETIPKGMPGSGDYSSEEVLLAAGEQIPRRLAAATNSQK